MEKKKTIKMKYVRNSEKLIGLMKEHEIQLKYTKTQRKLTRYINNLNILHNTSFYLFSIIVSVECPLPDI